MKVNFDAPNYFPTPSVEYPCLLWSLITKVKWVVNAFLCQGNGLSLCAYVRHLCTGTKAHPLGSLEGKTSKAQPL